MRRKWFPTACATRSWHEQATLSNTVVCLPAAVSALWSRLNVSTQHATLRCYVDGRSLGSSAWSLGTAPRQQTQHYRSRRHYWAVTGDVSGSPVTLRGLVGLQCRRRVGGQRWKWGLGVAVVTLRGPLYSTTAGRACTMTRRRAAVGR